MVDGICHNDVHFIFKRCYKLKLTQKEKKMLSGYYGKGVQKAMELLVSVGEIYNAEHMIPVSSSHLVIPEIQLFPKGKEAQWGTEITQVFLEGVEKFAIPTTTNATILDIDKAKKLKIPNWFIRDMKLIFQRTMEIYESKGAIPNYSCAPYFDFLFRKNEHLGGAESIQVLYNNSVNGARINRESGPTALCTAITGVTPCFGMHIKENRYGKVLFRLDERLNADKFSDADLNAIGYFAGRQCLDKIPIFQGFSRYMNQTELKYLCVPLAVTAGIPMIHVVGVTPEAETLDDALGGKNPEKIINITKESIKSSYDMLNTAGDSDKIDYIALGCPHCSLQELREISDLLEGKKISSDLIFFVAVSTIKYDLANRMGIVNKIEDAGGVVVKGMCPGSSIFGRYGKELNVKTVMTNSAKNAHYIGAHSGGFVKTIFASKQKCIEAALTGDWR